MNNYVLLSPIGGSDPISNECDGAFLHICRVYRPQKVYMYLSSEMLKRHEEKNDNRYIFCLDKLNKLLGINIKYEIIGRAELIDVQLFDSFYFEFEKIIRKIREENQGVQIILNISSGSPAMKSTLMILSTFDEVGDLLTVQVDTPTKCQNPHIENQDNYDKELYWEFNRDNSKEFINRCKEHKSVNLIVKFKKEIILKHLEVFDYSAAVNVAESIRGFLNVNAYNLLKAAECRIQLDQSGMDKILKGNSKSLLPVNDSEKRKIFEYICWLQIKVERKDYSDFLRGCTPVIVELFRIYLKERCNVNVLDYCEQRKYAYWLLREKLSSDAIGRLLLNELDDKFMHGRGYSNSVYTSIHLCVMIEALHVDKTDLNDIRLLRGVEDKARNSAAHNIVAVTEKWIEERVGLKPKQIVDKMKRLAKRIEITTSEEDWNSYIRMNKIIAESMEANDN